VVFAIAMLVAGLTTLLVSPGRTGAPKGSEPTSVAKPTDLAPSLPPLPTPGPNTQLKEVEDQELIRVATANIYKRLSWSQAASDLSRLVDSDTDLIGLNEISPGRAASIRSWVATRSGWHFYSPQPHQLCSGRRIRCCGMTTSWCCWMREVNTEVLRPLGAMRWIRGGSPGRSSGSGKLVRRSTSWSPTWIRPWNVEGFRVRIEL